MKFEVEVFEKSCEAPRRERDDWRVAEVGGETWGRKRGDRQVQEKRVRVGQLGVGGLERKKDGFRGEGCGGVRPS